MNRIRKLRKKNNLTLDDLSNSIGIGKSTLSRYENNLRNPSEIIWSKLATVFNVSVPYLQAIDCSISTLKFKNKKEAISFINKFFKKNNISLKELKNDRTA